MLVYTVVKGRMLQWCPAFYYEEQGSGASSKRGQALKHAVGTVPALLIIACLTNPLVRFAQGPVAGDEFSGPVFPQGAGEGKSG